MVDKVKSDLEKQVEIIIKHFLMNADLVDEDICCLHGVIHDEDIPIHQVETDTVGTHFICEDMEMLKGIAERVIMLDNDTLYIDQNDPFLDTTHKLAVARLMNEIRQHVTIFEKAVKHLGLAEYKSEGNGEYCDIGDHYIKKDVIYYSMYLPTYDVSRDICGNCLWEIGIWASDGDVFDWMKHRYRHDEIVVAIFEIYRAFMITHD